MSSGGLPVSRAVAWLRERAQAKQDGRGLPALERPVRPRVAAPRRGAIGGWWSARLAAGAGVGAGAFLRHRLARYLAGLPVPPTQLPVAIAIEEDGTIAARPRGADERGTPPWAEAYLRSHGAPALQDDAHLAQARIARFDAELEARRPRVEQARRELEEAAREPAIAELDGGGAESLGRPRVPPPWTAALQLLAALLLLAEAWQLALPVLGAAGVHTGELRGELARDPAGVLLGFAFALGAAVSLFYFAGVAHRRARTLFEALPAPRRARWMALSAAAALAFAAALSWSIAGLRPGDASPVDLLHARFTLFLAALALPITTSCLLQLGRRLAARRAEALAAATAWDQLRFRTLAGWSRRSAALAAERAELARLEAEREAAARRLRALRQRALLAERYVAEAAAVEAADLDRLCHAVVGALELDRYQLLRLSPAAAEPRPQASRREAAGPSLGLAG